jgi:hypothetical protein
MPNNPQQNHLLATLPAAAYKRLLPHLEPIGWDPGSVLCEAGRRQEHVFFPTSALVSLLCSTQQGFMTNMAVVGNAGVIGVAFSMGDGAPSTRAVVQCAGNGYRISASTLKTEFDRGGGLQILMLRFARTLIAQMAQTALCNVVHTAEQQLCRWLLLSLDGLPSNERTTPELLEELPGMHGDELIQAGLGLWAAESIQYRRGKITVLNRAKLENRACECYGLMKRESGQLLSGRRTALEALV